MTVDPKIRRPHLRVLLKKICKILGKLKVSNEDEVLETVEKRKKLQEKLRAAAVEQEKEGGEKRAKGETGERRARRDKKGIRKTERMGRERTRQEAFSSTARS